VSDLEWELLEAAPVYSGYLNVERRRYRMPDGSVSDWDILRAERTVATLALTDAGTVLLVRQFRPGPGRVLLDLPGGNVADGEDVLAACERELLEETGYRAGSLTLAGRFWLAGRATIEAHAVVATGCRFERPSAPDVEEFMELVEVSFDVFLRHLRTGELTDLGVAYLCLDHLGGMAPDR
jgi:ADP-ribose diphosphatase